MAKRIIYCNSVDDLENVAKQVIELFPGKKFFAVSGNMGAGKTTFIKAFCRLLGVEHVVNSPTFSLVNEYLNNKGETIYHFDLYRINKIQEVYDIGYEDYFWSDAWCFVEWPEKIESLLPEDIVHINIKETSSGARELHCSLNKDLIN